MAPEAEVTITFQVDVGDTGQTCWFVPNLAVIAATGTQWTSGAVTTIGTCNRILCRWCLEDIDATCNIDSGVNDSGTPWTPPTAVKSGS